MLSLRSFGFPDFSEAVNYENVRFFCKQINTYKRIVEKLFSFLKPSPFFGKLIELQIVLLPKNGTERWKKTAVLMDGIKLFQSKYKRLKSISNARSESERVPFWYLVSYFT